MPKTQESSTRFGALPLEEVACYLCGATGGKLLVDDPPFRVMLCRCGFGYTSPRVAGDRIHEIYDGEYFSSPRAEEFGYACYVHDLEGYLRTFRLKARTIRPYKPEGRVLEVGCAAGAFLRVMQDLGYEVEGVEVSEAILQTARGLGLEKLHAGRLDQLDLPERSFDIVALFDVIEHVADPVAELRRCERLMKPDGILVIQTQNVDSWTRRILGSHWQHFKQPEHIYHFSPPTLREVLSRAGFTVVLNKRRHAGKYVSFADIADRAHRVARVPRVLCSPLRAIGRRFLYLNPLDEMFVIARRTGVPAGKNGMREGP